MGESMTREREIEQAKKWRQTNWHDSVPPLLDEALAAYGQEKFEAGERLGREDSDSVYWPALREQWHIEFGRELGQEGGHIMNIVDGVRELLRAEREECSRLICNQCASSIPIENDKYHYSICMHPGGRIERFNYRPCPAAAIRARGVAQEEGQ